MLHCLIDPRTCRIGLDQAKLQKGYTLGEIATHSGHAPGGAQMGSVESGFAGMSSSSDVP